MKAHNMLPTTSHDEQARQDFVADLRRHLSSEVMPGNHKIYEQLVEPAFRRQHGHAPQSVKDVRGAMTRNDYYQLWSAMQRRSQELIWEAVIDPIEREHEQLIGRYRDIASAPSSGGTLELDPNLTVPRYHTAVDIHIQPGAYHSEFARDDVAAGAIYEAGLPIYIGAGFGSRNDALGNILLTYLQESDPDFQPRSILDMGCAVGNSTLPWHVAFPSATLYAIDVAAPCLRYAHARAEMLEVPVHFSQQNAENTNFDDASFDLIVSHIMLHETSRAALGNIFRECYRLLKPGGRMLHLEVPRGSGPFEQFMLQWECYNNNETFAAYLTDADLPAHAVAAGFAPENVGMHAADSGFGKGQKLYSDADFRWPVLMGHKA